MDNVSVDVAIEPKSFTILSNYQELLQHILPSKYSLQVIKRQTKKNANTLIFDGINMSDKSKRQSRINLEKRNFNEDFTPKRCQKIIQILKNSPQIGPFLYPVDPVALNIPNYLEIIKQPMDILTIENKIKLFEYNNDEEFYNDLRLIWNNAKLFNSPQTDIYMIAEKMQIETEQLIQQSTDKLFQKKEQAKPLQDKRKKEHNIKELTQQEQNELNESIKQLQGQDLIGIWNIVQDYIGNEGDDKKEFSVKQLPLFIQKELQKYVKSKIKMSEIKQKQVVQQKEPRIQPFQDNKFTQQQIRSDYIQPKVQINEPLVNPPMEKKQINQESSESSFLSEFDTD